MLSLYKTLLWSGRTRGLSLSPLAVLQATTRLAPVGAGAQHGAASWPAACLPGLKPQFSTQGRARSGSATRGHRPKDCVDEAEERTGEMGVGGGSPWRRQPKANLLMVSWHQF